MSMLNTRCLLPATMQYRTRPHVPESLSVALTTASASVAMPTYHVTLWMERINTGELSLTSCTWIATSVVAPVPSSTLLSTPTMSSSLAVVFIQVLWPLAKRHGMLVVSVCMCVCLSDDNFRKPWHRKFIFAHAAYLRGLRVKFVYEGHRVKVKVTGAKKVENSYSCNVKLRSAITPVLKNRAVEP